MNSTIYTNMDSIRNYNVFNKNQTAASKAMTHATTGLRIASVADGPADWAISERMRERTNSLKQASQNIQNDNALAKTAADGIANTVEVLNTLKARVLKAADASSNDDDRSAILTEIKTLIDQIDENAKVKYNGVNLLDGSVDMKTTTETEETEGGEDEGGGVDDGDGGDDGEGGEEGTVTPYTAPTATGSTSTFSFQVGDDNTMKVDLDIPDMSASSLGLDNVNNATVEKLKNTEDSDTIIGDINNAITIALNAAANVGSIQQRLGYTADSVDTQIENLQASDSAIRDADIAKEISDYLKWNALSQASQYMLAQSNQNAYSVVNLLQ